MRVGRDSLAVNQKSQGNGRSKWQLCDTPYPKKRFSEVALGLYKAVVDVWLLQNQKREYNKQTTMQAYRRLPWPPAAMGRL